MIVQPKRSQRIIEPDVDELELEALALELELELLNYV